MANSPRRLYWDSCTWLGLLKEEPSKKELIRPFWVGAQNGEYEIWTSTAVYIEVFRVDPERGLTLEESDKIIDAMLDAPHVIRVQVDMEIGKMARHLRRAHNPPLKKRWDAIHLATAIIHNADIFHTFDGSDLLPLNEQINRADGTLLRICIPDPNEGLPLLANGRDK
jgi:predicted nucleic acid-binding protein